jgi:hypothetical protein
MMRMKPLLSDTLSVINVGPDLFNRSLAEHRTACLQLDWSPPGDGSPALAWRLAQLMGDAEDAAAPGSRTDRANRVAIDRILAAQPVLVDVALHARDLWPEMGRTLYHAGAPLAWDAMCGPMQGAMIGAALYEGWAASPEAARRMLESGAIGFAQCHDVGAVGPMTGIISPSMPVFVVRNQTHGNVSYTNINEGIGKILRFGANGPEVIERLKWFEQVLAPILKRAVLASGGIDLKPIQSQALLMGDEVHSRHVAATALFFMKLTVAMTGAGVESAAAHEVLSFIADTSQFFLNLSMASAKATMDAAHGLEGCSIVTAIARNGVTTAIRVSGLGRQWFEAPSGVPVGLFFAGFSQQDANPDLGDSAITETAGFGGFSFAASRRSPCWPAGRWRSRLSIRARCTRSPTGATRPIPFRRWTLPQRRWASTSARCSTPASSRSSPPGSRTRSRASGRSAPVW